MGWKWEGAHQVLICALVMVFIRALVTLAVMCGRLLTGEGQVFCKKGGREILMDEKLKCSLRLW